MIFLPRWHDPAARPRPPLFTVSGVLVAPAARIAPVLLHVPLGLLGENALPLAMRDVPVRNCGMAAAYELVGGPERFTALPVRPPQGHLIHLDVDSARNAIAVHGGWWFRGEFRVEDDPQSFGSRVSYSVFNVAPGMSRFLVSALHLVRNPRKAAADALANVLAVLSRELGVVSVPAAATPRRAKAASRPG